MWNSQVIHILALVSMATETLCQSGDGEWGSGIDDVYSAKVSINDTKQTAGDEPARVKGIPQWSTIAASPTSSPPVLLYELHQDKCSVHFSTRKASARWLKAEREELSYLQALQHANKAVMEDLVQFVGAELEEQSYEEVIKDNVLGIQQDHKSCHEVVEKVEEDLQKQLEGEVVGSPTGMHKMREATSAFDEMLTAASEMASRLERSSQTLHASFTKQLRDIRIHR
ncbi:uncharacterized protein LOC114457858 [Gouania willdenowi]|uniref:uncharacterized protein LOC114457858 n=1 Tax=Gouania willdenowi TaxID=441366 RepID=UPI001054419F|nr:uncharacterized protein LOC114457858 [Gouania willdenowi]